MWSLTLPQVAAILAAALVGFRTLDLQGQRLIDDRMLNVVFVLMLTTAILGAHSHSTFRASHDGRITSPIAFSNGCADRSSSVKSWCRAATRETPWTRTG